MMVISWCDDLGSPELCLIMSATDEQLREIREWIHEHGGAMYTDMVVIKSASVRTAFNLRWA